MKKFLLHSIIFLGILAVLLHVRPLYLLYGDKYKQTVAGSDIYYSIFKSKQKKKTKKILFGDSVAQQLFPNKTNNDTISSMACNQSIAMVGHFILLNNYLNAGNQVDTVYMLFSPFSFQNNLNQVYTYHYFLKPFYIAEYKPLFTETVNRQVEKVPYSRFCRIPYILTSDWAPDFISKAVTDYTFLSPISIEYLHKIKELSIQHHFKVIILPTPASKRKKPAIEKMDQNEVAKNNLTDLFENYFKNIIYFDDSNFFDGTHIRNPQDFISRYRNDLIK